MEALWKNIIYSIRMLSKRPSFSVLAVIAIALGIGANTTIFSVVNTVLLRPLPFDNPEQLVMLSTQQRNQALDGRGSFSALDLSDVCRCIHSANGGVSVSLFGSGATSDES